MASRFDFVMKGDGAHVGPLVTEWGLSDHSAIGSVVQVDALVRVVDSCEMVDWDAVAITVADEDKGWYEGLVGDCAYERLVDFRRRHLKWIRICGRSKRWWDSELSSQVGVVWRPRRWWVACGNRNVFRSEVSNMKGLVSEKKYRCSRDFWEDSGLQDPWEVIRWARDPWRYE